MKAYLFLFVMLFSIFAHSAWEPSGGKSVIITQVVVEGSVNVSRVYIRTSPVLDVGECTNTSGSTLIRLSPANVKADSKTLTSQQLYSAALAAYMSAKPVQLNIATCDDWNRPQAVAIWLK